jgi:transcriptional regulator GlxA family with amidase domain
MTRQILILAPPRATLLDVAGPWEVFSRSSQAGKYLVSVVSTTKSKSVTTKFGLDLLCTQSIHTIKGDIDTLLIAGLPDPLDNLPNAELTAWLRSVAPRVRRLASVCTGAFHLAHAGLLRNRRATTHWRYCEQLAARYPDIAVDPNPIYVRDGNVYTSAGITAGIDLALAMVEEDCGHRVALDVARDLVVYLRRPAGQSQFSAALSQQTATRHCLRELQGWIVDHLDQRLAVEELAELANMSPRNFARLFAREVGTTPAKFVERLRVEAARRRLEEASDSVDAVAAQVGFGSSQSMRRSFLRHLRVTPADYRSSVRTTTIH